jgi:8-amino-7-oxononanoate synthase
VLDFTSALYLGIRHEHGALAPWTELTTGRPAALSEHPDAERVAARLAGLQGFERATLGASTLHLFGDLLGQMADEGASFFMDRGLYPVARWGLERAAARGAAVRAFGHFDPAALQQSIERRNARRGYPIAIVDGFCTRCGRVAPLAAYQKVLEPHNGKVLVDDTQALGVLGANPSTVTPFGFGGGGTPRWSGVASRGLIVIASLAKAFGAPLAALSGSRAMVERFEERSETRVHCSPPSTAAIHAADHALAVNEAQGNTRRDHLAKLVRYFRSGARKAGFHPSSDLFPVQTLEIASEDYAARCHRGLLELGIRSILRPGTGRSSAGITFLITGRHRTEEIEFLTRGLTRINAVVRRRATVRGHS